MATDDQPHPKAHQQAHERRVRLFHTAIVSSKAKRAEKNHSQELHRLMNKPAFQSIVDAIGRLASEHQLTDAEAAEQFIETFRELDQLWESYVFQEGIEQLKSPQPPPFNKGSESHNQNGF
jgi:hypothetical protein